MSERISERCENRAARITLAVLILVISSLLGAVANAQVRLVSDADHDRYQSLFPVTNSEAINDLLTDPNLVFYTREEIPQAVQLWGGINNHNLGIFSVNHDISASANLPNGADFKKRRSIPALGNDPRGFGNGGAEHPWGQPFGTELVVNTTKIGFVRFSGPIAWTVKLLPGDPIVRDRLMTIVWFFPFGTTFGELLVQRGPDGRDYAYDLRLRTRQTDTWTPDLFRPMTSAEKTVEFAKTRRPDWQQNVLLARFIQHLDNDDRAMTMVEFRDNHPTVAFRTTAIVDKLPPVGDDKLVAEMLGGVKWESQVGVDWASGDANCIGPTRDGTDQSFGLVPPGFTGGLPKVSKQQCMQCHRDTLTHVRVFEDIVGPNNRDRDWYGRVPGSDGIISFHIFRKDAIANRNERRDKVDIMRRITNAQTPQEKNAALTELENKVLNTKLLQAGLLERFDQSKHTPDRYNFLVQPKR